MAETVLIIGATGRLGGTVARRLVAEGTPIRALARDPSRVRIPGVEAVRGDADRQAGIPCFLLPQQRDD